MNNDKFKYFDNRLILCVFLMLIFGLIVISSASINIASSANKFPFYYTVRQMIYILIGLTNVFILLFIPLNIIKKFSAHALFSVFILLFLVLIIGKEINGSRRWISIAGLGFQPSEFCKYLLIIYIASYLERRSDEVRSNWWGFIKPLIILFIVSGLLFAEPDFGTSVVLICTVLGMIFLAGAKLNQFFILMLITLIGIAFIAVSEPYRISRLTTYINPWVYKFGSGYQLTQALIAFGRGGWFGIGLGESIQKLFYLPEAHTDFIFSIIAEELGLFGALVVFSLLIYLAYKAIKIGKAAEIRLDLFSAYIAYGIGILFICQVWINIGVNTGLLPTKGLALPFFSYGGSNIIVSCISSGTLLRIDYENRIFHQKKQKNKYNK